MWKWSCPRPQVLKLLSHFASCASETASLFPSSPPLPLHLSQRAADVGLRQVPTRGQLFSGSLVVPREFSLHHSGGAASPLIHPTGPRVSLCYFLLGLRLAPLPMNVETLLGVRSPLIVHSSFLFANSCL